MAETTGGRYTNSAPLEPACVTRATRVTDRNLRRSMSVGKLETNHGPLIKLTDLNNYVCEKITTL